MRRRTFDALLATGGLVVAIILAVAGGLLSWAHSFADNNVHSQLVAQKIAFPPAAGIKAQNDAEITKYVTPYAGQKVDNGQKAQVFADHYIKVHLAKVADGKTYSEVSSAFLQMKPTDPNYQAVAGQRQTLFMGETLRGLLLYAYAFATMGTIAGYAAIVSFAAAALLIVLVGFGFWHSRRSRLSVADEGQLVGAHV